MSKVNNPRIDAQKNVLNMLLSADFTKAVEDYTGEFIDNNWKPSFHYYQGIEHYRQVIQDELNRLEAEEAKWKPAQQQDKEEGK